MREEISGAIDFVVSRGARYADIRMEKGYATVIEVQDGVFREMSYGIDHGVGVRVLYGNSWGFASSNESSKSGLRLREIFEDALRIARALALSSHGSESKSKSKSEPIKLAEAPSITDHFRLNPKINPADVSIEEKKRMIKDAYRAAKEYSPLIKLSLIHI